MGILHVERIGGMGNFGGMGSRVRSQGKVDTTELSAADKKAIDALFKASPKAATGADGFRYKISRTTSQGTETIEAPEGALPETLTQCVKDELV